EERVGVLCAGSPPARRFSDEDTEVARAVAHLAAIAIKRLELIEGLTNATIVKDLFEALAAGASAFAAAKAAEVRCDLTQPYLIVCAEPAAGRSRPPASGEPPQRRSAKNYPSSPPAPRSRPGPAPCPRRRRSAPNR